MVLQVTFLPIASPIAREDAYSSNACCWLRGMMIVRTMTVREVTVWDATARDVTAGDVTARDECVLESDFSLYVQYGFSWDVRFKICGATA